MSETTSGFVVPELLAMRVAGSPDDTVMNVDDSASITYAEWDRRSNAVAHGLLQRGVQRGDVVALFFGGLDWIEYIVGYMAILKSGGTAIHLNDTMPPEEVRRRLRQTAPVGIIRGEAQTAPEHDGAWAATVGELDSGDASPVDVKITPEDYSDILYSSGTTTMSKSVRVPHGNLTFGKGPEGFRQLGDPRPLITPMQVGTTASVTTTNVALTLRATLIVSPPGDVERMAELIERYEVGSVMINPMVAVRLVTARVHERHDFSTVHTLGTAAAPMPPPIAERLLEMFPGATLRGSYTEISAVPGVIVHTYNPEKPLGIGKPSPSTQMMIVDSQGQPVPEGEVGEIWIRGSAPRRIPVDPALDHPGGWTHTEDLGRVDSDGDLILLDRIHDAVPVNGHLVSTIEVESVVYRHPGVREAAVIGLPGEDGKPRVAAIIAWNESADVDGLRAFLAERLDPYQLPESFHTVDSLPFSPNGKVRKKELREQLLAERDAGTAS